MEKIVLGQGCESDFDETVVAIDAWYDRHSRAWCIQLLNKDGFQVGNAAWAGNKADKDAEVAWLRREHNI